MPNIVRTVALLSRREGVSFEASCRYWREVHTPLAAQLPERCVQRHVQAPRAAFGVDCYASGPRGNGKREGERGRSTRVCQRTQFPEPPRRRDHR